MSFTIEWEFSLNYIWSFLSINKLNWKIYGLIINHINHIKLAVFSVKRAASLLKKSFLLNFLQIILGIKRNAL